MNKMKIDMLYDIPLEEKQAPTVHTVELISNLTRLQNNVRLFIPKSKHAIQDKQFDIVSLPMLNIRFLHNISYQLVLFFYYLFYGLGCRKPDIIYARVSGFAISPFILAKLLKTPYVVEINGLMINELKLNNSSKLITNIFKAVERLNYKYAKTIVAVNEPLKQAIKKIYKIPDKKIIVIENGANTELFRPINTEDVKSDLEENYNYIGFSGSFARWHGLEYLVKSAPLILKEVANTKFILLGDGVMKKEIIQIVDDLNLTDKFSFIKSVPYEEVPRYINMFDICVILKEKDIPGCPLKFLEYMACGKPVIATNTQDFSALEEYNAGILVDSEKPQDIADGIITLLKNKSLREEMGKNGRKYVLENRSWESVARRVAEVLDQTVEAYNKKSKKN